ncbi:MAG: UbiX family flavin prenyltransferase [Rickettsiales bacterium]|jgi:4-hydroxy-3-polyprenylbenzoate decarboxylase|nr:UbiX family flavin prenyltransferase [Rickettsiales bacterium]
MKLIVAITGASGVIFGVRLLEILKETKNVQVHLIISKSANITIKSETKYKVSDIKSLADFSYSIENIGACMSSGSFRTDGMIIAPCSIKTMSAIAHSYCDNLITRSADVILKERKKLVLMLRETPLHLAHLRNMTMIAENGGIIYPPVPAFYQNPQNIDDIVNHTVCRVLDLFDINCDKIKRWEGLF